MLRASSRLLCAAVLLAAACGDDDAAADAVDITTYAGTDSFPLAFVAVQDGDGSWQPLSSDDGHYRAHVDGRSFGVMHLCGVDTGLISIGFHHALRDERPAINIFCSPSAPRATLKVNLAGAGGAVAVHVGSEGRVVESGSFALFNNVIPGLVDVFAIERDEAGQPLRIGALRDIDVAEGEGVEVTIDLDDAVAPGAEHTVNLLNVVDTSYVTRASLMTTTGTEVVLVEVSGEDSFSYPAVPTSLRQAGDLYRFSAIPPVPDCDDDIFARSVRDVLPPRNPSAIRWLKDPADVSLDLPDDFVDIEIDADNDRPSVTVAPGVDPDVVLLDASDGVGRSVEVVLTSGWLSASENAWTMPVLEEITGWQSEWGPVDTLEWRAIAGWIGGGEAPLETLDQPPWLATRPQPDWNGRTERYAEVADDFQ